MHKNLILAALFLATASAPVAAQIAMPVTGTVSGGALDSAIGTVAQTARRALDGSIGGLESLPERASRVARDRVERLSQFVRERRDAVERDSNGEPARKGVLLITDPPADLSQRLAGSGFAVTGIDRLGDVGISVAAVRVPEGLPLAKAEAALRRLMPDSEISADTLSFQSGSVATARTGAAGRRSAPPEIAAPVGVVDGGAAGAVAEQRGFALGAPMPSAHGSAVASLLQGAGVRRVLVADVYGKDRAGGSALAIARAFDWLVGRGVRTINISLVGPANPVLAKVVAAAQRRGVVVVAPVGNDGPAAPPAYPASYPLVLAVTGVDARNRPLIEAGRALHLDYAAPGADMRAANAAGQMVPVRGTSFAAPLVAARAAAATGQDVRQVLDHEAVDLGPRGADTSFGRGLICGQCRR